MFRFSDPITCPKKSVGSEFCRKVGWVRFFAGDDSVQVVIFGDRVSPSLYVQIFSINVFIGFLLCRERLKLIPRLQEK